jgi:uncharacterized protein YbjT (DUF2867 family)
MRILVVGSTGNVGGHVLTQLTTTGLHLRVMVRNPEGVHHPPGVEVMQGDLTLPETLDACLDGVDSVFLVWTAPPATIGAVVERIANKARRIVFLSAPLKTEHPFFQQPNPLRTVTEQIERQIEKSGLEWTFLRAGIFAGNARHWWAPQIRRGNLVRWPYLSAPTAPVDERDIAAVAVRALGEDRNIGMEYVLTGPRSLTQLEQVSTIGRVIGRALQIEEISPNEARSEFRIPAVLLDAWAAAIDQPAYVTSSIAEITGRPPRTFIDWANDHIAQFQA